MKKTVTMLLFLACCMAFAQNASSEAAEAAAETVEQSSGSALWNVLYGGSIVNLIIWLGLFATSFTTIIFAVNAFSFLHPAHRLQQH